MSNRIRTYLNYLFENMTYLWDVDVDDKVTHWAKVQSLSTGNTVRMDILDSSINLSSYNAILMLVNNSGKNKQGSTGDNLFTSIVIRKNETIGTIRYSICTYLTFTQILLRMVSHIRGILTLYPWYLIIVDFIVNVQIIAMVLIIII